VEELICSDLDLAALDAEMNRYYRKLEGSLAGAPGVLWKIGSVPETSELLQQRLQRTANGE
jgi:hypothetical protein